MRQKMKDMKWNEPASDEDSSYGITAVNADEPDDANLVCEPDESLLENDPLYRSIRKIWMEELGLPRLSASHSFFSDLGGDSILAVMVLERMRSELNIKLPYFILYRYRTLGQLVAYLRRTGAKKVMLDFLRRPADQDAPVILFVPPLKGGAETYSLSVDSFPGHYGLCVLTFDIIDEDNCVFFSLDTLMAEAVNVVLQAGFRQPVLFGYSMGGLLAFELAWRARAKLIPRIIIADIPPAKRGKINLLYFISNDIRLVLKGILKRDIRSLKVNIWHIGFCFRYFFIRDHVVRNFETRNPLAMSEAAHIRYYLMLDHRLYDGDLLLLRSGDGMFSKQRFNWAKWVTGDIQIKSLNSDHLDLISPATIKTIGKLVADFVEKKTAD